MLTGAGCFNSSSTKSSSLPPDQEEYDANAEVDVEAETPDLNANSTVEDYEDVSAEIKDLSEDIEKMNAEINSLNSVNTNLE
ncbi:MAG: hypothetical protein UT30_C0002G0044 [Candidatus Uhrbacteria bacterium GW2011_GWF2_39_13]|uniref:Uncharacterized protein n=1 Tax=Candidatus Uhrbacteria bacterium GW2011_GWF2_39_13 TaxID=1618995 RepID=A0A0G0QTJ0_9BACT|nr:MAG: hypothetical protein UT30_C0002G0044 [Candidatus Uhrbacteria bacterium GW2011_GWF2_39_13]